MMPDIFLYLILLFITGATLMLMLYFIITLSDIECDHKNAYRACCSLNFWLIPKVASHGFVTLLLMIHGKMYLSAVNLPVVAWQIYKMNTLPAGSLGYFDSTEIHNRGMVRWHTKKSILNALFLLCLFFVYMYCWIQALLEGDPIRRHESDQIVTEF